MHSMHTKSFFAYYAGGTKLPWPSKLIVCNIQGHFVIVRYGGDALQSFVVYIYDDITEKTTFSNIKHELHCNSVTISCI